MRRPSTRTIALSLLLLAAGVTAWRIGRSSPPVHVFEQDGRVYNARDGEELHGWSVEMVYFTDTQEDSRRVGLHRRPDDLVNRLLTFLGRSPEPSFLDAFEVALSDRGREFVVTQGVWPADAGATPSVAGVWDCSGDERTGPLELRKDGAILGLGDAYGEWRWGCVDDILLIGLLNSGRTDWEIQGAALLAPDRRSFRGAMGILVASSFHGTRRD